MWIPGFIMIWFSSILVFMSLSITALGKHEGILDSIRATYKNGAEIKERYKKMQRELNEPGKIHPCESGKPKLYESDRSIAAYTAKGKIIFGDMRQETGFRLILDYSTTIDIPAIIECFPQHHSNKIVILGAKEFVYYLVLHGAENDTKLELALSTEDVKDNKRVFVLEVVEAMPKLIKIYKNRYNKEAAGNWLRIQKNHGNATTRCTNAINRGNTVFETPASKWEVAEGKFVTGNHILRLSKDFEINIRGYIECLYNILDPEKETKEIIRKEKLYHTISSQNEQLKPSEFVQIYGSKNINRKKDEPQIFTLI